ncbi:DMT family transporter, partial [Streptomyces spiralis]
TPPAAIFAFFDICRLLRGHCCRSLSWTLARTTASRMGATTYAVPALVVLMSWLALGEVPGLLTLAGGVLCLAGVAVSRSRARTRTASGAGAAAPGAAVPETVPEPRPERT